MTGRRRGPGYPAGVAVLVGRANGLVRLHDLTGGSAVEYPATAAHRKPPHGLGVPDEERAAAERAAAKQAIAGTVGGAAAAYLIQFIPVWLAPNGPMRVPFIRWRFHGGRLV